MDCPIVSRNRAGQTPDIKSCLDIDTLGKKLHKMKSLSLD